MQTKTDRFYPGFVAELNSGRVLVVEHKGGHISEPPQSIEQRDLGELWEFKSQGKVPFLWTAYRDSKGRGAFDQIKAEIGAF